MTLRVEPLGLPDCSVLRFDCHRDQRGGFTKVFCAGLFERLGLPTELREAYVSTSRRGTIRGLHFQTPPHQHHKYVCCLSGRVWDVVLDLRHGSPTYGKHATVTLDGATPSMVQVASGCAHGFLALDEPAQMLYLVQTEHAPDHDTGVRWDSAGIEWPLSEAPIVSERDQGLPRLQGFSTPFRYQTGE